MSIINNASSGSSIRLLSLIDRVLTRQKAPKLRAELIELCRPDNLPSSDGAKKRFVDNLNFWIEEGLWCESEPGVSKVDGSLDNKGLQLSKLPSKLLALIINNNNEKDIFDGNRTQPFLIAITRLLAQDKYTFAGGYRLKSGLVNKDNEVKVADAVAQSINESNESNPLLEYGEFLGFLEPYDTGYIVDPTRAISVYLPFLFEDVADKKMSIQNFIKALSEVLPMMDGGHFRKQIEPLKPEYQKKSSHVISASLSHSLFRLQSDFRIHLSGASDSETAMELTLPKGVKKQRLTDIQFTGR